jgi:CP family cyanate transporter-like MFS transporter
MIVAMVSTGTLRGRGRRLIWLLPLVGIAAVAFNLRPLVTSVGPFLGEIQGELGLSGTVTGALTALPVLCFAAFGALTPSLAARFGARRVVTVSMVVVAAGLVTRALAPEQATFFLASAVALAGVAASNVLVPVLVRQYYPERIGTVTGLYAMVLSGGTALSAAATVPVADAAGQGWRTGLGVWAATALLAVVPWLVARAPAAELTERRGTRHERAARTARPSMFRSPTAWAMAIFFGCQSLGAYIVMGWMPLILRDAGIHATEAGLLLALTTAIGIPVALLLPTFAARLPDQRLVVGVLTGITAFGYLGLAVAPAMTPWLWATLIGLGNGAFPLALAMIGWRTRTASYTAALSGFTQAGGYLLAAAGPMAFGALHDVTSGWTIPIALMAVFLVPQFIAGLVAGRNRYVEDELSDPGGEMVEPASTVSTQPRAAAVSAR